MFEKDKYKFLDFSPISLVNTEIVGERGKQILQLNNELNEYNVVLKDLILNKPPMVIRNQMLNIAYYIIGDSDLFKDFSEKKDIQIARVAKTLGISRGFLEKWTDYIIIYTLILSNPNKNYIQDYLSIAEEVHMPLKDVSKKSNDEFQEIRGIILSKRGKNAIVLTSKGEFCKIKVDNDKAVGEEVTGDVSKDLKDFKGYISLITALILLLIIAAVYKYNKVETTMVIDGIATIKVEVNDFDKVLSITDNGQDVEAFKGLRDDNVDTVLSSILRNAEENGMIDEGESIIITVTGKSIEYGSLESTESFVKEKGIDIRFNNSGNEHNIN